MAQLLDLNPVNDLGGGVGNRQNIAEYDKSIKATFSYQHHKKCELQNILESMI